MRLLFSALVLAHVGRAFIMTPTTAPRVSQLSGGMKFVKQPNERCVAIAHVRGMHGCAQVSSYYCSVWGAFRPRSTQVSVHLEALPFRPKRVGGF